MTVTGEAALPLLVLIRALSLVLYMRIVYVCAPVPPLGQTSAKVTVT